MTNWHTSTCKTNGIHIHYTRTGGSKPPIILLHGLAADGLCWTSVAHILAKEYDIIMPDARGHGKSSVPDYGYRYEDHANDVIGLINSLNLSSPSLLGHSMGGMIAAVVASFNPNLLHSLILAEPTFLSLKVQREVYDSDLTEQHRRILNTPLEEVLAYLQNRHPNRSPELIELIVRARFKTSVEAFDVLTPPNPDYKKLVSAIDVPSLFVFGDKGVVEPFIVEELTHLNPRFQINQMQGAGHGLHYDQPEQFAAVVDSFIRSID